MRPIDRGRRGASIVASQHGAAAFSQLGSLTISPFSGSVGDHLDSSAAPAEPARPQPAARSKHRPSVPGLPPLDEFRCHCKVRSVRPARPHVSSAVAGCAAAVLVPPPAADAQVCSPRVSRLQHHCTPLTMYPPHHSTG